MSLFFLNGKFLKMKVPGNRGQNGKQGYFFCLDLQTAVIGTSRLIKINKVRIEPAVHIVYAEYPASLDFLFLFMPGCIDCRKIQAVIGRQSVLVDPAVILRQRTFNDIKFLRIGSGIAAGIYKYAG